MRHNVLTMSQAFAFPLPVGWAAVSAASSSKSVTGRRLSLGIMFSSLWLASSWLFAPSFAFGYDLYTTKMKVSAAFVHVITAIIALISWRRNLPVKDAPFLRSVSRIIRGTLGSLWAFAPSNPTTDPDDETTNASSWGLCASGLLWFTILPVVSPYPLATVPTIMGKRLSRPASAFTCLACICAFCLKDASEKKGNATNSEVTRIRTGLLVGSSFHLILLALKLIGVDGGGFLLPGRGLWEVYPAMLAVPFATFSSIALHALICFSALT